MHKYSVLIVIVVILFVFSFVPVSAAGFDASIIDLLPAAEYKIYTVGGGTYLSDYPGGNTGKDSNITFYWDNSVNSNDYDYIYFNIRSDKDISTVRFGQDNSSGYTQVASKIGMYDGLYQYRIPTNGVFFEKFMLRVFVGSATGANVLVESCYGLKSNKVPITQFNHNSYYEYFDWSHDAAHNNTAFPSQKHASGGVRDVPFSLNLRKEVHPTTSFEWSYQANIIEVYPNNLQYKSISKVSILFVASNIDEATVSLNVGGIKELLPCELSVMGSAHIWPDHTSDFYLWPMQYYELTFDVTGYDLNDPSTCFYIYFNNIPYYYDVDWMYVYWSIIGAYYEPYNPPTPWYQVFWSWLKGGLRDLGDYIVNGFTGAQDKQTNDILTGGDSADAITGEKDDLQSQSDQIKEAEDQISSVERPDIDIISWISPLLTYDNNSLLLVSVIAENPLVTTLMTIVVTFAFVGFVFFGKRG